MRAGRRARWAIGLLAALAGAAPARAMPPARVDSLRVQLERLAAFGFTGQIIVAEGDSIVASIAAGDADERGRRVGPDTRFAVGSITKSLTGAVAVRLASRGVLALDDTLPRWLAAVPEDKRGISLRQLLSHTSGLPEDGSDVAEADTRDEVVAKVLADPLVAPPGSRFHYSNAGFQLAAAMLERASGRSFVDLARAEVFAPAGLSASGTGAAFARGVRDGCDGRNEWRTLGSLQDWRQVWVGTGAGDFVTHARDLWRWVRALQGSGPLSRAELDTLLARRAPIGDAWHYGFGVYLVPSVGGPDVVSIGGDVPGWHAMAWGERVAPFRAVVVVTSGERFGRNLHVRAIQRELSRIVSGQPAAAPPEPASMNAQALTPLLGVWALAGGGRATLERSRGGLRLLLAGPEAIDVVGDPDSARVRAARDARAEAVLRAAAGRKGLASVLLEVERRHWERLLRDQLADSERRLGPFSDVAIDGTLEMPWLENVQRTYARLRFAKGTRDVSLAWLGGGLLDVAFDEGRPAPIVLPVAPLAEGGFAAYDVLDDTTLRIEPFRDARGAGLLLTGAGGRAVARRPARGR